jgi:hypothetical protein
MEVFRQFSMPFNVAVKEMLEMTRDQGEMCQTHVRQYREVGTAFLKVGQALKQDGRKFSLSLCLLKWFCYLSRDIKFCASVSLSKI